MNRRDSVTIRYRCDDDRRMTIRLEQQLYWTLLHLDGSAVAAARLTDASPGTMRALRRRLRRVWDREIGLPWPPDPERIENVMEVAE